MVTKWKQVLLEGGFSKELKKKDNELEEVNKKLEEAMVALQKRSHDRNHEEKTEFDGRFLYEIVDPENATSITATEIMVTG